MSVFQEITNKNQICFILILFSILTIFVSIIVPPFEAPDEPAHLQYINFLATNLKLPNQYEHFIGEEGHQPPLYYLLLSFLIKTIDSNNRINIKTIESHYFSIKDLSEFIVINGYNKELFNFHVIRIAQIIFAVITIIVLYKLLLLLTEGNTYIANIGTLFAATLPQFIFISAMINNDNLANMLATISIFYIFKIFKKPYELKYYIFFSISIGSYIITKVSYLFLIPPFTLLILILLLKHQNKARIIKNILISGILILLISGWWLIYNKHIYGDFFSLQVQIRTLPFLLDEKSIFSPYFLDGSFSKILFHSFVGIFGWMNIWTPSWIKNVYFCLVLVSLVSYIMFAKYRMRFVS